MQGKTTLSQPSAPATAADSAQARLALRLAYALAAALALALLLVNLTSTPQPWFDDGYVMAVGKMLATQGIYGLPDSSGPWVLDPSITSGPTLMLPLALTFKLFGAGLLQARLFAVGLALLTLLAYALLARRLVGPAAAAGALLLVLAGNHETYGTFVRLGRQALGEIPALGLWLAAVLLWLAAHDQRPTANGQRPTANDQRLATNGQRRTASGQGLGRTGFNTRRWAMIAGCGLCLGAAVVTKPQMVMGVAPGLALVCLADRLYYRQSSWLAFIVPGALMVGCVGLWYLAQMQMLTPSVFFAKSQVLKAGVQSNILSIDPVHIRTAGGVIWRSGFLLWGLPGLLYGCWLARERSRAGLAHAWLAALVLVWLAWFALLSIGWARYAFAPFILTPIWTAKLALDLWRRAAPRGRTALVVALAALVLFNGSALAREVFGPQDRSAEGFSAYLQTSLPADAVVASWEWNLDTTAPQRFYHPPPLLMYQVIDSMQRGQLLARGAYDPAPGRPAYVVDGPFSNWTGIYRAFIEQRCEPVTTIGTYSLYRVVR